MFYIILSTSVQLFVNNGVFFFVSFLFFFTSGVDFELHLNLSGCDVENGSAAAGPGKDSDPDAPDALQHHEHYQILT